MHINSLTTDNVKHIRMARFGKERFPEQYPATIDEWAEPVVGDTPEMAMLRPLLKNTNLESRNLRLTYDANKDGWDPVKFHSKVDKQGGAIMLCTTNTGIKCGGYNPKGWVVSWKNACNLQLPPTWRT